MLKRAEMETVGLIPAAGKATRISPLPCSKEIFPVGFHEPGSDLSGRPKVACHYLLENMQQAGVSKAYIILRDGKWDIPAYLADGSMLDMHFAYLMMNSPFGVPFSLNQAYAFVKDSMVMFGFPDIIFRPKGAFISLIKRQMQNKSDLVLGVFPVSEPQKWDTIEMDHDGRIHAVQCKPGNSAMRHTWLIAVWTPVFTQFMHDYLDPLKKWSDLPDEKEMAMGHLIQAAIESQLTVEGVLFQCGSCRDIGTPDDLVEAMLRRKQVSRAA